MKYIFSLLVALLSLGGFIEITEHKASIYEVQVNAQMADIHSQIEKLKATRVENAQTFGAFNPSGGQTYRLSSSIGSSDTTVHLASFKEPISNIPYTMTYLSTDIGYGTLAPQSTSYSEFISFSGITQNSNGTADLTGVTRGLSRTPGTGGCVASTTLKSAHAGQTIFTLSNSPCFYAEYATLRTSATVTAPWIFATSGLPRVDYRVTDANIIAGGTSTLVTYNLLANTALAGTVDMSEVIKGVGEAGTAAEQASSTIFGGTGAVAVMRTRYATDTPQSGCNTSFTSTAGAGCSVIAQLTGKIRQTWLDIFSTANIWTGTQIWTASSTHTSTSTFSATTTFWGGSGGVSIGTSTGTTTGNLIVTGNASTTNLKVSVLCSGCVGSTTAYEIITNSAGGPTTNTAVVSVTATCSTGKIAIGGGGSETVSTSLAVIRDSYPATINSWTVTAQAFANGNANTVSAYAICEQP